MLSWYKDLISLRRQLPSLTTGRMDMVGTRCNEEAKWLIVQHYDVSIMCNFAERTQTVPYGPARVRNVLLASKQPVELSADGVVMPANSVAILGRIES